MKKKDEIVFNNIEVLRRKGNLTYRNLAKKMDVKPQMIANIKNGSRGIGTELLKKFAKALKVDESVLLKGIENSQDKNDDWTMKALVESMQGQINVQSLGIESLLKRIEAQGKALQSLQEHCNRISRKLAEAASKGDITVLG